MDETLRGAEIAAAWEDEARAQRELYRQAMEAYAEAVFNGVELEEKLRDERAMSERLISTLLACRSALDQIPEDALGRDVITGHHYRDELRVSVSKAISDYDELLDKNL